MVFKPTKKKIIASLTTLAVSTALVHVPQASATIIIPTGQAYVDIVGKDIDPDTGNIGWSAFARVPVTDPTLNSGNYPMENELSFVLPAECINKPHIKNAQQLDIGEDNNYVKYPFKDLDALAKDKRVVTEVINKIKSDPKAAIFFQTYYPQFYYTVINGDTAKSIDLNIAIKTGEGLNESNVSKTSLKENTELLNKYFPEDAKNLKENNENILGIVNFQSQTFVESAPTPSWDNNFNDVVYALIRDQYQYTNDDGKIVYVTDYQRIPAEWGTKTHTSAATLNGYHNAPSNVFPNIIDPTIYHLVTQKPYDIVFGGSNPNKTNDKKLWNQLEASQSLNGVAFYGKLPEKGTAISELTDNDVKDFSNWLSTLVGVDVSGMTIIPIGNIMKTDTLINKNTKIIPLRESTIPVDDKPLEPQEFVKVVDKNSGKEFWQRTFYTAAEGMQFDVEAQADLNCLVDKGLMKPGKTFYIPAQWFWKKRLYADKSENGDVLGKALHYSSTSIGGINFVDVTNIDKTQPGTQGYHNFITPTWGLGINTKDNPNAEIITDPKTGEEILYRKKYADWKVHPPVNGKTNEFITRGILKADRTNSYDMRQGIYDNPFCMVSRNVNYKDDLNTGITKLKDLSSIDYDEQFPGAIKNGISVENPMYAHNYIEHTNAYGMGINANAFSVEDMCDQAGAKITIPEKQTTTPSVPTVTETTTPEVPTVTETTTPKAPTVTETTTPEVPTVTETTTSKVTTTSEQPPVTKVTTPPTKDGSSSGSTGIIGIFTAIAALVGIISLIAQAVVKTPPAPTPTPVKPVPQKTIPKNDKNIVIKNGLACPANTWVKGMCKPLD